MIGRAMTASWNKKLQKVQILALPFILMLFLCISPTMIWAADKNLPPYETQLRRLSSIVGALMHLDPLCNQSDPKSWHKTMTAILKAENPDDVRNRQLTDRFNQSYRTYSSTYETCNNQARKVTSLYREEATSILTNLQLKHAR
ncbi:TIGR02301 family protein [Cohaesibacter gelatinilyticus]|uniref:TIGR02301 family protein n=1 Tax=Cohaesibacter gelatinilyticus TaxID=372072 RepID=A0A285NEV2_9HYPH|nr:TIGR02301 family protein [Cohaesibacter gelatinilyticus]SNZ07979.1 TIGR02301 family protein [Cohaesibacter gelatinilyticus]